MAAWVWPTLTANNCFFIVLHSHPLGKIVRGEKHYESRPRQVHRNLVVLVSAMKDNPKLGWETDNSIQPSTIYGVARVDRVVRGAAESFSTYDWVLNPICMLSHPLPLHGVPVGRTGGGHVAPRKEHAPALDKINGALHTYTAGIHTYTHIHTHTHAYTHTHIYKYTHSHTHCSAEYADAADEAHSDCT